MLFCVPETEKITILGHDNADFDSLAASFLLCDLFRSFDYQAEVAIPGGMDPSAREQIARYGYDPLPCVRETHPQDRLFLVDHSRTEHPGQVLGCIDHHPVRTLPDYPYVQIESASSATRMIARWMEERGCELSRDQLAMTVFSIFRDTQSLQSTKYDAARDGLFLDDQIRALKMDRTALIREGYGMSDPALPDETLAENDLKYFFYGDRRVGTSGVVSDVPDSQRTEALLEILRKRRLREGLCLWVFFCNDPIRHRSQVWYLGDREVVQHYDFLVSRSKDIMPMVENWLCGKK